MALHTISLCAGGGGLDLGLELAIPSARAVCYVEREAFGIARLVEAMQQGHLAEAPVWTDVSTFRGRAWRGLVDGVIGGIPCQPHSYAGRRKGADDERDLWPDTRRIVNECRPWFVLIENVAGMLVGPEGQTAGAARVRRDLAAMSFRSEIVLVRASEVRASHERARVFVLALADDQSFRWREGKRGADIRKWQRATSGDGRSGVGLADACGVGRWPEGDDDGPSGRPTACGGSLADAISCGHGRDAGAPRRGSIGRAASEGAGARVVGVGLADTNIVELQRKPSARQFAQRKSDDGVGLFPPGPDDRDAWTRIAVARPDLLPATTQPRLRGMADGMASRVDQLRMLGNGVVPLQAAHALRILVDQHNRFRPSAAAEHLRRLIHGEP